MGTNLARVGRFGGGDDQVLMVADWGKIVENLNVQMVQDTQLYKRLEWEDEDKVVDVPEVQVSQSTQVQVRKTTTELPQLQNVDNITDMPEGQLVRKTIELPQLQAVEKNEGDHDNEIDDKNNGCNKSNATNDDSTVVIRTILCHEYDNLGLLEQPTDQTRQRTYYVSPQPEVVSSCIGALLCSFSDMGPGGWLVLGLVCKFRQ